MGDGEESIVIKSGTMDSRGVVSATSYFLYIFDNSGVMITSVTLTGENYGEWFSEMINVFRVKRKFGFVNGTISKFFVNDFNLEFWFSVNLMIMGWIWMFIESRVRSTVTFVQDFYKLWENLRKRFSVGNKVLVYYLKE